MIGFVETRDVYEENIEELVGDHTIGILHCREPEHIRGDVYVDVRRLRRAILAYEEEFGDRFAEIALCEREGGDGAPFLTLVPEEGSHRAIVLAPRAHTDSGEFRTDAEELLTAADEDGDSA